MHLAAVLSQRWTSELARNRGRLPWLQGAATQVYACVAEELEGRSGSYLASCRVATPSRKARDDALATDLWELSHAQLVQALDRLHSQ